MPIGLMRRPRIEVPLIELYVRRLAIQPKGQFAASLFDQRVCLFVDHGLEACDAPVYRRIIQSVAMY